jgi:hypothetical protein
LEKNKIKAFANARVNVMILEISSPKIMEERLTTTTTSNKAINTEKQAQ